MTPVLVGNPAIEIVARLPFRKVGRLLESIEPLNRHQRLDLLLRGSPRRFFPFLLRYRYFALALALNVPGNYLIGGGGGIVLIAGASKIYSVPGFLFTILLAVAPVPLLVLISAPRS